MNSLGKEVSAANIGKLIIGKNDLRMYSLIAVSRGEKAIANDDFERVKARLFGAHDRPCSPRAAHDEDFCWRTRALEKLQGKRQATKI
jgi:hypothetical protein